MAKKIQIDLQVKDKGSVEVKKFSKTTKRSFKSVEQSAKKMNSSLSKSVAKLAALTGGVAALTKLSKSFLNTARMTENFKVRLKVLLGSVEEGNRLFKSMAEYASKVPFEYQAIMESATMLAGVLKGGVQDINRWMPLIGDLAAATGLGITTTTEQVMRMLSAGAAAADRFRERGVLAMLGFTSGVSYSAKETAQKLMQAWTKVGSQFKGATSDMAKTWDGLMSMMSDKWTQIKQSIMDAGIYDALKNVLKSILDMMDTWVIKATDVSGSIQKIADNINIANAFVKDHKDILVSILKVLGAIVAIWVGGKIIAGAGLLVAAMKSVWKSAGFVLLFFKGIGTEIGMLSRGTLSIGLLFKNWGALLKHAWGYLKVIKFSIMGLVYLISEQLVGALWESYKAVGDLSGVWDITIRKMKSAWEGFVHFFASALIYTLKGFEIMLDVLLYKPLEAFINLMIDGFNELITQLNKIPKIDIPLLSNYVQTTLADITQADKLIEDERKRHLEALKRIEDEYLQTKTGKLSQVRGIAKSIVGDIRTDQPLTSAPAPDMWKEWAASSEGYIKDMYDKWSSKAEETTNKVTASYVTMDDRFRHLMQDMTERTKTWYEENEVLLKSAGISMRDTFADAFTDFVTGAKNAQEAFSDMAMSIGRDLIRMATQALITKAIMAGIGAFSGGGTTPTTIRGGQGGGYGFKNGGITRSAAGGAEFNGPKTGYPALLHGNEAVIPLQNGAVPVNMKGSQGGVTNNITMNVQAAEGMSNEEAANQGRNMMRGVHAEIDKRLLYQMHPGGLLYAGGR